MITAEHVTKNFGEIRAVDDVSLEIKEGRVFGLIGTNGAGKSTILRLICGIYRPDGGTIETDGEPVFENPSAKKKIFYISDEQFFPLNASPEDIMGYYGKYYVNFDGDWFRELLKRFELPENRKIRTFSRGMKKQLAILCGLASKTEYLLCDETFDGLDPVMRQAVKSIFAGEMENRNFTPVIASHNLRELEDICDHVGLLHRGDMILSEDLDAVKDDIHKLQFVPREGTDEAELLQGIQILGMERRGSLITLTCRGEADMIMRQIRWAEPVFMEMLPLTLEEIFISETGVKGYDIRKIIG